MEIDRAKQMDGGSYYGHQKDGGSLVVDVCMLMRSEQLWIVEFEDMGTFSTPRVLAGSSGWTRLFTDSTVGSVASEGLKQRCFSPEVGVLERRGKGPRLRACRYSRGASFTHRFAIMVYHESVT